MRVPFDSTEYHKALRAFDGQHCLACGQELPQDRKDRARRGSILSKCCKEACKEAFLKKTLKNWAQTRLKIIKRDSFTCQDCGYIAPHEFEWKFEDCDYRWLSSFGTKPPGISYIDWKFRCGLRAHITKNWQSDHNLTVHHIRPISEGGEEYDKANCVTLCIDCHKARHSTTSNRARKHATLELFCKGVDA